LRFPRLLLTVGLCCLLLGACADSVAAGPQSYVVRPQDTLYSIAWRHDLDFRDLARWNGLGRDYRITVGQVLVLGPGGAPGPGKTATLGKPSTAGKTAAPEHGTPRAAVNGSVKWVWPTDRVGAPRPVPGGGILVSGLLGQEVRAASAGRVVYTGGGLRGYGNLIIIKHADSLLSAYAHNREMLVHDGQEVVIGQVIARMGEGANQAPVLYFEIRQNGRPIDPLPLLPKIM
jgi:lipoprotein NlpD